MILFCYHAICLMTSHYKTMTVWPSFTLYNRLQRVKHGLCLLMSVTFQLTFTFFKSCLPTMWKLFIKVRIYFTGTFNTFFIHSMVQLAKTDISKGINQIQIQILIHYTWCAKIKLTFWVGSHYQGYNDSIRILGLHPANERRHYKVTPSLIGWVQT